MSAILDAFFNPILPIFAIAAIGYLFGKINFFNADMAGVINRFVILVSLPALLFSFLVSAPFSEFNWLLVGAYFASSLFIYALGFCLMRYAFKLGPRESLLLGMAACFTNHVFFVLYIAPNVYGEAATIPILSIITFDAFLIFGGTFLYMDVVVSGARSPIEALKVFFKNPMIIAMIIGLTVGLLNIPVHDGLITYANFAGGAAAPASMFALGVVLSGAVITKFDGPATTITVMKLFLHPLLLFVACLVLLPVELSNGDIWAKTMIFAAAGPTGAMPFVIALQHGVSIDRLVKAIVFSTVLSLFSLAVLASF